MISTTPTPRSRLAATCAAALILVAACGGDDDADGADRSGLSAYLATLPAEVAAGGDPVEISVGDLDRAAAAAGIERPDRDDHDGVRDFLATLSGLRVDGADPAGAPTFVPFPALLGVTGGQLDEFESELGFTAADVSWFADRSTPPATLTVYGGDLDADRLESAMGPDEEGRWALGPADGEFDLADRTAVRQLGESLRLALDDDHLVIGRTTDAVDAALAVDDAETSLADHAIVGPLVAAVDAQEVYAATFFVGHAFAAVPPLADPDLDAEAVEQLFDEVLPAPFVGLAVGSGVDADGEPVVVMAYAHLDATAAEANAEAIPAIVADGRSSQTAMPWSDMFAGVEVSATDDHVVVARLALTDEAPAVIGHQIAVRRDSLASHA